MPRYDVARSVSSFKPDPVDVQSLTIRLSNDQVLLVCFEAQKLGLQM
jgi:hypothetical protein